MSKQKEFIKKIAPIAQKNSKNTLPSVTIAQAILESAWGESTLAKDYNNYFGIKAIGNQDSVNMGTLEDDGSGNYYQIKDGFRVFKDIGEGFAEHDKFFVSTPWREKNYQPVINAKDAYEQAKALQSCGYATDTRYAEKLISIIDTYDLTIYDKKPDNVAYVNGKRITFNKK